MYVDVAFPLNINKTFSYSIPEELAEGVQVGMRVLAPLGKAKRAGVVISLSDTPAVEEVKDILDCIDEEPVLSDEILKLTEWMAEYYMASYGQALKCAIHGEMSVISKRIVTPKDFSEEQIEELAEHAPRQSELLEIVLESGPSSIKSLKELFGESGLYSTLARLESKGFVEINSDIKKSVTPKTVRVAILNQPINETVSVIEGFDKRSFKQKAILEFLVDKSKNGEKEIPISDIVRTVDSSQSPINSLKEKGLIRIEERELIRDPLNFNEVAKDEPIELNEDQSTAFEEIKRSVDRVGHAASLPEVFLLRGVTGSGKTEVYMHAMEHVLERGKDVIMLVPEISLTPQTTNRLVRRFGDCVTVLHSKLSEGERYDAWRQIKKGEFDIVVGPRSAVFAPVQNLGLIVIDEEHETSYKQDRPAPRYHAREVAIKRAELAKCTVILGTATPSLESYYKAKQGEYKLLELPKRVDDIPMPPVDIIDMREELTRKGNRSIFSGKLRDSIKGRLAKKQQVILFLNRRGHSTYVFCRSCGYVEKCENCSVSLTYHFDTKSVVCHHCGHSHPAPRSCPKCYSPCIRYFGLGTQQVEEEVRKAFPKAKIMRMDTDSTSRKNSHREILEEFREQEVDILIGTQMIAKGLDFPNVTLVGVIIADTALHLPDFRSGERAFNLLTQVSGRSGRSKIGGEVIIQTYNPEHYSIQAAQTHDYSQFYEQEIEFRESLLYPPFTNAATILLQCVTEDSLVNAANALAAELKLHGEEKYPDVEIRGPVPAPLSKIRGKHRWHMLLRSRNPAHIRELIQLSIETAPAYVTGGNVEIIVDIDPMSVL